MTEGEASTESILNHLLILSTRETDPSQVSDAEPGVLHNSPCSALLTVQQHQQEQSQENWSSQAVTVNFLFQLFNVFL